MDNYVLIHISKRAFQVTEEAYNYVTLYLLEMEKNIAPVLYSISYDVESEEILAEIENRIANNFERHIQFGDNIVSLIQIKEILSSINPNQIVKEILSVKEQSLENLKRNEENSADEEKTQYHNGSNQHSFEPKQKLYRLTKNSIVGGVCSCLGSYLGVEPFLIRTLFLLLLFFTIPIAIIIYVILLVLIPLEKSPNALPPKGLELSQLSKSILSIITIILKVVVITSAIFIVPILIMSILFWFAIFFSLEDILEYSLWFIDFDISLLEEISKISWLLNLSLISLFVATIIPIITIILLAIQIITNNIFIKRVGYLIMLSLWITSIGFLTFSWLKILFSTHNFEI